MFKLPSKPRFSSRTLANALAATALTITASLSFAQETAIRKTLTKQLPDLPPIAAVQETPIKGVYEVVIGDGEVIYASADGRYIFQGDIIDVEQKISLTEKRINNLTAVDFKKLNTKDAIQIVRGNGKRHMALFEDPNCGYCKRFEKQLKTIDNVTVHLYLLPILGPDSVEKSTNIWCAKDKAKAWMDWMTKDVVPAKAMGKCDTTALVRNTKLAQKHRIHGTPTIIFSDNTRVGGAIGMDRVEGYLSTAKPVK